MSNYIKSMDTIEPMEYLTPEQQQQANYFFSQGVACAKREDYWNAAENYKHAVALGHAGAQNNLALLYKNGKGVEQDLEKAFSLFLDAAVHGNVFAMRNVAVCYFNGQGICNDFDFAASWLRTATLRYDGRAMLMLGAIYEDKRDGDWGQARYWYEQALQSNDAYVQEKAREALSSKFKYGSARDAEELAIQREQCRWEDIPNEHFHGKEYYKHDVDFTKFVYRDRVYYKTDTYLRSSKLDATDIRSIAIETEYLPYIAVNITGIYLYANDDMRFEVKRYDFDGNLIQQYCEERYVDKIYIYDEKVYFSRESASGELISCLNMGTGICMPIYRHSEKISDLYAMESKLIFSHYSSWYMYDTITTELKPFGNAACKIEFWDLNRGVYWEKVQGYETDLGNRKKEMQYLIPRPIFGKPEEVVPEAPIWYWVDCKGVANREFFNGIRHYYSEHYWSLASSNLYGQVYEWKEAGHGECDKFEVAGGYIFVNLNVDEYAQYTAEHIKSDMLRRGWFED